MTWEVDFYEDTDGSRPVEEFFETLPDEHLGKVLQMTRLLRERGPDLPFPYSSQVEGKLRELRVQAGKARYRILYYGDRNRVFILLHAFRKRTEQIPKRDKQLALERMQADERRKAQKGGT